MLFYITATPNDEAKPFQKSILSANFSDLKRRIFTFLIYMLR